MLLEDALFADNLLADKFLADSLHLPYSFTSHAFSS
jgi:hypothetical protein